MMYRLLWRLVIPLGACIGGGWLAFQWWLGSDQATRKVAAILAEALGTRVTVGRLELNSSACAALDVCVFEPGAAADDQPLLRIDRAETDLALTDFLRGSAHPKTLTLHGAHAVLRYDGNWDLTTKFPKLKPSDQPTPTLHIACGRVSFRRPNAPDCTILNIDGSTAATQGLVRFTGTVNDPAWGGLWRAEAAVPPAGGATTLLVTTPGVRVDQATLKRVPFVSPSVWETVQLSGETPVSVKVNIPDNHEKTHYRIELAPTNTDVTVPCIGINASSARGNVVVEDKFVVLRNVVGRIADGELRLKAGDLNFRQPTTVMAFQLEANRLDLRALPLKWNVPTLPGVTGRLSGAANIGLQVIGHVIVPTGSGDLRIEPDIIGLIRLRERRVTFQADRNGFHFR